MAFVANNAAEMKRVIVTVLTDFQQWGKNTLTKIYYIVDCPTYK